MVSGRFNLREAKLSAVARLVVLSIAFAGMGSTANAESKAHQHGAGHLNIAIDGQHVEIELIAPGADIVGFEHEPKTEGEKQSISESATKLRNGEALFRFPNDAQCRLTESEVDSSLLEQEDHKEDHKHGSEKTHAEFHAHYQFQCTNPEILTHADVGYFNYFPSAQLLTVQKITASGQSVQRLTPKATRLTF